MSDQDEELSVFELTPIEAKSRYNMVELHYLKEKTLPICPLCRFSVVFSELEEHLVKCIKYKHQIKNVQLKLTPTKIEEKVEEEKEEISKDPRNVKGNRNSYEKGVQAIEEITPKKRKMSSKGQTDEVVIDEEKKEEVEDKMTEKQIENMKPPVLKSILKQMKVNFPENATTKNLIKLVKENYFKNK